MQVGPAAAFMPQFNVPQIDPNATAQSNQQKVGNLLAAGKIAPAEAAGLQRSIASTNPDPATEQLRQQQIGGLLDRLALPQRSFYDQDMLMQLTIGPAGGGSRSAPDSRV